MNDTLARPRTDLVLQLAGVHRTFRNGRQALAGVDLAIAPGESVGLIGRNGAGKTTLMRCLLGQLRPQHGQLALFGVDPIAEPVAVKRRIGYVAEESLLPAGMLVDDALALHRELFPDWDDAYANDLLVHFGLVTDVHVGALSKGQGRLLALVCALGHRPHLLLLDEPAGGLDPVVRRVMIGAAVDYLADSGATMLFSSHLMQDVERLASRVVVLDQGRVVLDEPVDVLLEGFAVLTAPAAREDLLAGARSWRRVGDHLHAVFADAANRVRERLGDRLPAEASVTAAPLEELFVEIVEGRR